MKTPIFNKLTPIEENEIIIDEPDNSKRVIDLIINIIPDQELGFKLSTNIEEWVYFTLHEIIYTNNNALPYMREVGISLDNYIWEQNFSLIKDKLGDELRRAFSNISTVKLLSLNITQKDPYTIVIHLAIKYEAKTFSLAIPIKIRPQTPDEEQNGT